MMRKQVNKEFLTVSDWVLMEEMEPGWTAVIDAADSVYSGSTQTWIFAYLLCPCNSLHSDYRAVWGAETQVAPLICMSNKN